jgi:hypothetical protein
MLPLAGSRFPTSHHELKDAISRGLLHYGITAREVSVEGGTFPAVDSLRVDLTGARVTRELRLASSAKMGTERMQVGKTRVIAEPMYFEKAPLNLDLSADHAILSLGATASSTAVLTLAAAENGEITLTTRRRDLEVFVQELVQSVAGRQGVEIKSTQLQLDSRGPRSLTFRAEVKAKMFIMTANVVVSGDLDIDDLLNARFAHLTCTGDGMVATAATTLVRPYFKKLESRVFPLLAFSLGDVKVRDVSLETGETLRLHARFAG